MASKYHVTSMKASAKVFPKHPKVDKLTKGNHSDKPGKKGKM